MTVTGARVGSAVETVTLLTALSTRELPVDECLERWERHNVEQLIGLACSTLDGAGLDATEVTRALPTVQLGRVRGTAHVVERSSVAMAANPADSGFAWPSYFSRTFRAAYGVTPAEVRRANR